MELTDEQFKRRNGFLNELDELTKKYKIAICGCGHCESPWLDFEPDESGRYITDDNFYDNLCWSTE